MIISKVFVCLATFSCWLISEFTTGSLTTSSATVTKSKDIEFLGQATLPTGTQFKGTEVGGLSGITYDSRKNVYYSISDDRSQKAPARFYTLKIDLGGGSLKKVDVVNVTTLLKADGKPFPELSLDPEGIALTRDGKLFISSEGYADKLVKPFVNQFSLTGKQLQVLSIPLNFLPSAKESKGIRNNLAFESLTITPNQKYLFTATENALEQDGDVATITTGSPARILKYNLSAGLPIQEFIYLTEPIAGNAKISRFSANGLADLLAIDNTRLLSLERSFSLIKGNTIRLYEVSLAGADDISKIASLKAVNINKIKPAQKKLLFNFNQLNIPIDNIEGLTFGQCLPNGRRSLIFVSDNNFTSLQFTQILAFSVKDEQKLCPSSR